MVINEYSREVASKIVITARGPPIHSRPQQRPAHLIRHQGRPGRPHPSKESLEAWGEVARQPPPEGPEGPSALDPWPSNGPGEH